jgi:putative nucleotidyltransferase with HDIG domain
MAGVFRNRPNREPGEPQGAAAKTHPSPNVARASPAPIEAYAEALGLDANIVTARARSLDPEERVIAEAILTHFQANRPGPASFPSIALQVLDLVRDPEVNVGELARLVGLDAALSAAMLVLANSPVFRGVSSIRTVRDAVSRLGMQEVARLAAAISTRSLYQGGIRAEFELFGPIWNQLYYHAVTVARAASELAQVRRLAIPEEVFVAGMLHDVGKSIALRSLAALVLSKKIIDGEAESTQRVLHRVHVEVGGDVHREWRLPDHLVRVALLHHDASVPPGPENAEVHLVRLVSALNLLRFAGMQVHAEAFSEVVQSAGALGLSPERVQALQASLVETEQWVQMLFGDELGGPAAAH